MSVDQGYPAASSFERVVDALERHGCRPRIKGSGAQALCPAHEDHEPSLSVRYDASGYRTRVKCFTRCDDTDVLAVLGLGVADLYDEPKPKPSSSTPAKRASSSTRRSSTSNRSSTSKAPKKKTSPKLPPASAEYVYVDAEGETLYRVTRHSLDGGGKTFRCWRPGKTGGRRWLAGSPAADRYVLYRLPDLSRAVAAGETVYLVEGEKDAESGHKAGICATTSAFGASAAWQPQYTDELRGAQLVVVVADRDESGTGYERARCVRDELSTAGIPVRVVEGLTGKDLTDHLDAGHTVEQLVDVDEAKLTVPPERLAKVIPFPAESAYRHSGPVFVELDGQLWQARRGKDGDQDELFPILGCTARIVALYYGGIVGDDETDQASAARLQRVDVLARHPRNREERLLSIDARDWRSGDWLDSLWPDVDFKTSRAGRADLVRAIRAVSVDARSITEHLATGWRDLGSLGHGYIHADGAITRDGLVSLPTALPGPLASYALPAPPSDVDELRAAAEHSIGLMTDPDLTPAVALVIAGSAYRAILGPCGFVPAFVGAPEAGKSALALIAAQHFGGSRIHRDMRHYISMDADMGATIKAAQMWLHTAADTLLLCDDFAPDKGAATAAQRMGQFIRAAYNKSARDGLTRDRQMRAGGVPRGNPLLSAEMLPASESARQRMLRVVTPWATARVPAIRRLQRGEAADQRARFMSAVIQWCARRDLDAVREWVRDLEAGYADSLTGELGLSARAAEHCSRLAAAWRVAVTVMVDGGAWTSTEADAFMAEHVWPAVAAAAAADADPDEDTSMGRRIVRLLAEALITGQANIADEDGECPQSLEVAACGWRSVGHGHVPLGTRIGYVKRTRASGELRILLLPGDALAVATRRAEAEGITLGLTVPGASEALALADVGLQTSRENGKQVRRCLERVAGQRHRVWSLPLSALWGDDGDGPDDAQLALPTDPPTAPPVVDPDRAKTATQAQPPVPPVVKLPELTPCVGCGDLASHAFDGIPRHMECDPPARPDETTAEKVPEPPKEPPPAPADLPRGQSPQRAPERRSASRTEPRAPFRGDTAVLDVDGAHLPDGTVVSPPTEVAHAGDLALYAQNVLHLGSGGGKTRPLPGRLWLTPEWLRAQGLPGRSKTEKAQRAALRKLRRSPFFTAAYEAGWQQRTPDESPWITLWNGPAAVVLTSLAWTGHRAHVMTDDGADPSPAALARRMGLYGELLKRPFTVTPAVTGVELLEAIHGELAPTRLPDAPWALMADDFAWSRELTAAERTMKRAFVFDRSKSYLAASGATILGEGEPQLVMSPTPNPKKQAGAWLVAADSWPTDLSAALPSPYDPTGQNPDNRWVTSAGLDLLAKFGPVEVERAWLFPSSSRAMYGWADRLREALRQVQTWNKTGDDLDLVKVEAAVKATATNGIGRLAKLPADEDDPLAPHRRYRPDWRAEVISMHRANSMRAMIHAGRRGTFPVAMGKRDAVLIISDAETHEDAWPGRPEDFDATGHKLGAYKPDVRDGQRVAVPLGAWLDRITDETSPAGLISAAQDAAAPTREGDDE